MTDDVLDVDAMLNRVGSMSKYQYVLMLLFSFINIISAFHYFGQIFISVQPQYKCDVGEDFANATECTRRRLLDGKEEDCFSWKYEGYYGYVSIVEEVQGFLFEGASLTLFFQLDWVCHNSWIPVLGQSVFFTGSVLGSLIFGFLADRIGRLHVLVIANMMAFVGNLVTIVSTNPTLFVVSRFVAGCATDANFAMMYIIGKWKFQTRSKNY